MDVFWLYAEFSAFPKISNAWNVLPQKIVSLHILSSADSAEFYTHNEAKRGLDAVCCHLWMKIQQNNKYPVERPQIYVCFTCENIEIKV